MKQNFKVLKRKCIVLAQKFKDAELDKAAHDLLSCSTIIATIIDADTHEISHNPNMCKNRFCPICGIGKQLNHTADIEDLLKEMQAQNQPIYATALTLTLKSVEYTDIADTIDTYKKAWTKLINRKFIKNILLGYLYYIEVTYTSNEYCHPHMHVILFFKNKFAMCIPQTFWQKEWASATDANYNPQVKTNPLKSINDIVSYAHYCSKPMDINNVDNNILATIVLQFTHKRLFAMSKSLRFFSRNVKYKKKSLHKNQHRYYKLISVWHQTNYKVYGVEQQTFSLLPPYKPRYYSGAPPVT